VHDVLLNGIEYGIHNRLSNATENQLALLPLLQGVTLLEQVDKRLLLGGADFSTKGAYHILHQDQDPLTQFIWDSRVPNKVKVSG
jgi:hypothetical protein